VGLSMGNYQVGETVSSADQNITKQTCYAGNEYDVPDDWKLADWNGAINGGNYNVIFIEMHATWWASCNNSQNGQAGQAHQEYADNPHVKFINVLADLNQPYSCTDWGNMPEGGSCQIVEDTGYAYYNLFNSNNAYSSAAWIDHNMEVHYKTNVATSESIINEIDEMLDACGDLCMDCPTSGTGDVNADGQINVIDVVEILNVILNFNGEFTDECAQSSADFNSDNRVNVTDIVAIVNQILNP